MKKVPAMPASSRPFAGDVPRSETGTDRLTIAVGIATSGRAAILAEALADLARQTRRPDRVFVLYSKDEDIGDLPRTFEHSEFFQSAGGLCEKRNRIMDAASSFDLIFFMDDDFFCHPEYLRETEEAFLRDRRTVATTGIVLADGAKGPGLSLSKARNILKAASASPRAHQTPRAAFNTYGCNMAFRLATVREHGVRFDEQLPAYAWYEDIDFSRRLARFGSMLRLRNAFGVHLGAKVGRVSGRRLGYSQIANPIYLSRKGSFPWDHTARSVTRNFLANLVRSLAPESYIDRRGRLRGNLLAVADLLRGRMHPKRILTMR